MLGSYNRKKQSKIVAADGERKEKLTKMEQKKKKEEEDKKKTLPNIPEITIINLRGTKTLVHTKFSAETFLKALFLAVKKWKQPKFPSNVKER